MASISHIHEHQTAQSFDIALTADVLVIGGGPAGAWAGIAVARRGGKAVVVDKGYVGTSGAQATAGTGAYYTVPGDPIQRKNMIASRLPIAFGFADLEWIEKVYDQSFANLDLMSRWGYAWPKTADGFERRGGLRAGDAMFFLRSQLEKFGVTILDHSPATELLLSDGVAAGASGVNRQNGKAWSVRAGAVVLATGGTAFRSGIAGGNNLTGDGYLLAAEAGAELSGMEFSGQYGIVPKGSPTSKTAVYNSATLRDGNGEVVGRGKGTTVAEIETGHVWCILDKFDDKSAKGMRLSQPNTFQYFDRYTHQDPFKEQYEIEHILEGTIRASGGVAVGDEADTSVPGLFAAGDTTSRERLVGSNQSGAGPATAWTLASGTFAGDAALGFSKRFGNSIASRKVTAIGAAGLRPLEQRRDLEAKALIAGVQDEVLPLKKFYRRNGVDMSASLEKLDGLWSDARAHLAADTSLKGADRARAVSRAREAAALIYSARVIYRSALERTESRGLHRRSDYPTLDENQHQHIVASGVDEISIRRKPVIRSYLDKALAS